MDRVPEPEKPSRPETPTADAAAEFLKGFQDIRERHKGREGGIDPDAARLQAREFAKTEDEIMQIVKTFPAPLSPIPLSESFHEDITPGIAIYRAPDNDRASAVDIWTADEDIALNPNFIQSVMVGEMHPDELPDLDRVLNEEGVSPTYYLQIEATAQAGEPTLFSDEPIAENGSYFVDFYFDEFGNYLKLIKTNVLNVDLTTLGLEELQLSDRETVNEIRENSGAKKMGEFQLRDYKAELTPGDVELIGYSLQFLKDRLKAA